MPENDARQGEWWLRIDTPAIIYHPPEVEYYDWVAGIDDFVIVVLNSVQGLRRIAKADFYTLYQFASWYVPPAPMELQTSIAPVIMTDAVLSGSTLSIDPTYIERTVLELFGITREELPILRGFFRHTIETTIAAIGREVSALSNDPNYIMVRPDASTTIEELPAQHIPEPIVPPVYLMPLYLEYLASLAVKESKTIWERLLEDDKP